MSGPGVPYAAGMTLRRRMALCAVFPYAAALVAMALGA